MNFTEQITQASALNGNPNTGNIIAVDTRVMKIPLSEPFRFATNTLNFLPYTWARIITADGAVGYGEAPTYWDPTGETDLAAVGIINLWKDADDGLYTRNVGDVDGIREFMEKTSLQAYSGRCAIEMALLDSLGKILNKPAAEILGGVKNEVSSNAIIGLPDPESREDNRLQTVLAKVSDGAKVIKLKSSEKTYVRDLELARSISSYFDQHTKLSRPQLFVDANQSWPSSEVTAERMRELAKLGVGWIEQPISVIDKAGQEALAADRTMPIMLDESVMDYHSLEEELRYGRLNYANLKLAKAGGPFSALEWIKIERENNIPFSIGSMVESGLGMLANYAVAQVSDPAPLTCDFDAYSTVLDGLDVGFVKHGDIITRRNGFDLRPGLGYDQKQMDRAFRRGKSVKLTSRPSLRELAAILGDKIAH
jgi:L-alanine-DL-glutamate epimerase-like enolase superfamily enzyme